MNRQKRIDSLVERLRVLAREGQRDLAIAAVANADIWKPETTDPREVHLEDAGIDPRTCLYFDGVGSYFVSDLSRHSLTSLIREPYIGEPTARKIAKIAKAYGIGMVVASVSEQADWRAENIHAEVWPG